MSTNPRPSSAAKKNAKAPARRSRRLFLEALEDRTLLSVTSTLTNGILDIAFGADNDAANVSVAGSNVQVQAGGSTSTFATSSVTGINAHNVSGAKQSIGFASTLTLSGELDVSKLATVSITGANYSASAVKVTDATTISLQSSTLTTTGDQTFAATVTTNGSSGVLSTTGTGSAQVSVVGSTLTAANVTLTATSNLTVSAQQSSQSSSSLPDFENAQGTSSAQVSVTGSSAIHTTQNVAIQAATTDSTTATAKASSGSTSLNVDAAVAVAGVNSTALATLGGQSNVTAGGSFQLTAANTTTLTASADGSTGGGAAKGGTFADAELTGSTKASVTDSASVSAASVLVSATSTNTVSSSSKSTQGGASQNSSTTQQQLQNNSASTGGISVAGAFALTNLNSRQTEATITSTGPIAATGTLQVTSASATTSSATADASQTGGSSSSSSGFGAAVAVAIDQGSAGNRADVSGNANLTGSAVTIAAQLPAASAGQSAPTNSFSAQATSGAGSQSISGAGSFVLNAVSDSDEAFIRAGSAVTASGDLSLTAQNTSTNIATAQPGQNVTAGTFGIGISAAYNAPTNLTRAEIETGASVQGVRNLTLSATANDTTTTSAKGGAGSQDTTGTTAVTPVIAVTEATDQTSARVGSSAAAPTKLTGNLQISAAHTANTTTSSQGSTDATKAAIGFSLALNEATDTVAATAAFFQAGGTATLNATSAAASSASAKASVTGGETNSSTANKKLGDQKTKADQLSGKTGPNGTSATTADGDIGAAAAIASNVAAPTVQAAIESGGSVQAGGLLTLSASHNADASASGDGSEVGQPSGSGSGSSGSSQTPNAGFGVGVGVGLNTATLDTNASIGQNAIVVSHGLTLQTSMLSSANGSPAGTAADTTNDFTVSANSGAGATNIGVAGSLARSAVTNTSEAEIGTGAQVNAGSGGAGDNVSLNATATSSSSAGATSKLTGQANFGVGGSVALDFATNTTRAEIDSGAALTGANNLTLNATGNHTLKSTTSAGTQANISFTPSVAVIDDTNLTSAALDSGPLVSLTGALTATTSHTSAATGNATGQDAGTKAAIGTAVALSFLTDTSSVTLGRDVTTAGNVSANAASTTSATATSNASANGGTNEQAPSLTDRLKNFGDGALHPGGTSPSIGDRFNSGITKAIGKADGVGASGQGIGIAAALAGNAATDQTTASVADGVHITATGSFTLSTAANNDGSATAFGQAIGTSSKTSLAGAIAFNAVDVTNTASVGAATVRGNGITIAADLPASAHDDFKAVALGGAGSNQTTFAGSAGINSITDTTSAGASPGAVLNSSGALTVSSHSDVRLENAAGSATGSKNSGVGVAVAVNVVTDATDAALGAGSRADAATALTVSAQGSLAPVTGDIPGDPMAVAVGGDVQGGNGLAGSLTVNDLHETTHAHIDNSARVNTASAVSASGNRGVEVHASDRTTLNNLAGALNVSKSLGVGIGLDVDDLTKDTQAFIARSATVQADKDINVHAESTESATSITAALTGSFSAGLAGAISFYEPTTTTVASIGKDPTVPPGSTPTGAGATTLSGGNTTVAASHTTGITLFTGGVGASLNNTSVGAAFGRIATADTVDAAVAADAHVTARGSTGLSVTATGSESVTPLALGGSGSGGSGFAGSMILDSLNQTTAAHIDHGAVIDATSTVAGVAPSVAVTATDNTTLTGVAGAFIFVGFTGVGAGLDSESISKTTRAYIASGTTVNASQDVKVQAASTEQLVSISGAGSAGGSTAIMGAVGVVNLNVTTRAELGADPTSTAADPATIHASGNVVVTADDNNVLNVFAGSLGFSGGLSLGGSAAIPIVTKDVEAFIAGDATVTADALSSLAGATVNTGLFNPQFQAFSSGFGLPTQVHAPAVSPVDNSGSGHNDETNPSFTAIRVANPLTTAARGVAVTATSRDDVDTLGLSGSASFGAAVSLGLPISVISDTTHAFIDDGAKVNVDRTNAGANQSVLVSAGSDLHHLGVAVGAAVAGGIAGGPAAEFTVIHNTTTGDIGKGAQVFATLDVDVDARATEDILAVTAGIAVAGAAGIAGSVAVFSLNSIVHAFIDQNARVSAGRSVRVNSDDETDDDEIVGSIGLGLVGGLGASVGVVSIHKDTQAFLAAGAVVDGTANGPNLFIFPPPPQGVLVTAISSENVHNIAAAAGGSFGLSAAGGIADTVIDTTTAAHVDANAQVNANSTGAAGSQTVLLKAEDDVTSFSVGGGAAGGLGALAGGIDLGVIHNNTAAFVDTGATVEALGAVNIDAASTETVNSFAISGAGGLVGLNASVSAWSIGTDFSANYADSSGNSANSLSGSNGTADSFAASEVLHAPSGALTGLASYQGASPLGQQAATAGLQARQAVSRNAPTNTAVLNDLHTTPAASVPPGSSVFIATGATVTAGGNLDMEGTDSVTVNQTAGGLSLSGLLSIGASVDVLNLRSRTDAHIAGTAGAGGNLTAHARLDETTQQNSIAGQGSLFGALGAAVAVTNDTSTQSAALTGTASIPKTSGILAVWAQRFATLGATTGEAAGGAVAAGASFVKVNLGVPPPSTTSPVATTQATTSGAQVGQTPGQTVGTLAVNALSQVTVNASATGVSGGLITGQLNFADVEIAPVVAAGVTGGLITLANDLDLISDSENTITATTTGANVISGATGGESASLARLTPTSTVGLSNSTVSAGRDLNLTATGGGLGTAKATASSGAIFGSIGSVSVTDSRPVVSSGISAGPEQPNSVTAGRDIIVTSSISLGANTNSNNATAELIGAGSAFASSNDSGDSTASLGGGGLVVTAGRNVKVSGESSQDADAKAVAKGFGAIPTPAATGLAAVDPDTEATIGGASVTAAGLLTVQALVHDATATAQNIETDGAGGGSGSTSNATALVGSALQFFGAFPGTPSVLSGTATAQATIGGLTTVQGNQVELKADFINVQGAASAIASDGGVVVNPHTNSDAEVSTKADVVLSSQSQVIGTTSVTIEARHDGVFSSAASTNNNGGVGLATTCAATNNQATTSQVDGLSGAVIKTRQLTVEANSTLDQFLTSAVKNPLFGLFGPGVGVTSSTLTPVRKINWNANVVVLSAPDPELVLDAGGNVVKDVGVTFTTSPGTIILNAINNVPNSVPILFEANTLNTFGNTLHGAILGGSGTVTYVHNFDHVTIQNASPNDLVLRDINVFSSVQPTVDIFVENDSSFNFNIAHSFGGTRIDVENTAGTAQNILLSGAILNPLGTTQLVTGGSIGSNLAEQLQTAGLNLQAVQGSIHGVTSTSLLPFQLVQSDVAPAQLTAAAGQDVLLSAQVLLRQVLPAGTTFTITVPSIQAGGNIGFSTQDATLQTTLPPTPPFPPAMQSSVFEINSSGASTTPVLNRFHVPLEPVLPTLPVSFFGTGQAFVASTWNFTQVSAGGSITMQGGNGGTVSASGAIGVLSSGSVTLTT
jgi:hypothetical protein